MLSRSDFLRRLFGYLSFPLIAHPNSGKLQSFVNRGHSMDPTLSSGQVVYCDPDSYRRTLPQRGDIIVFHSPGYSPPLSLKRIVGLPGESIKISRGTVLINRRPLTEPYVNQQATYTIAALRIPPHALYVLGDNRMNSYDSHSWGPLDQKLVVGKVILSR